MSSIIEGYNYDIFISYRQKDNKGDRWVSEFVEALKTELESTFKEEISVYFDINPHDGLLETHDVDASLKDKLKCLVFIPIISRTYCDPKSFAWEHEFKAFIDFASHDRFGLKVKLPDGNVTNRVLPARIHDLDAEDIKLCEFLLGGYLRGVEFIYKEPGVNRPLTPGDDEKKNLNKTMYRNQINKVANAIKEINSGLKTRVTVPIKESAPLVGELEEDMKGDKMGRREKSSKLSGRKLLSGVIITAVLLATVLAYPKIFNRDKLHNIKDSEGRISVAVMPFQNMANDTTWNIWQDGIQNELITSLTNSEELKVRQTESVNNLIQSKGLNNYASLTPSVASNISQKLNANVFIYGSIKEVGNTIRINAQLVDSKTEESFKSFQIDGTPEKILPIVDSLSVMIKDYLIISKLKKVLSHDVQQFANTNSPEAFKYYIYGNNSFARRDYATAVTWYLQAINSDSAFLNAEIWLSMAYYNQGLYKEGGRWCHIIYEKRSQMPVQQKIWTNLIYAGYFKPISEGIKYCRQLLEIDDQQPIIYYQLGWSYSSLYQYEKAIPEFERALEIYKKWGIKPMWVFDYTGLGYAYHKTGQYKKENTLYTKAEADFPDDPSLIYGQAVLSLSEGKMKDADHYIEKYISARKENSIPEASIMDGVAGIYSDAGILAKAEEYYRKALSLQPENPERINNLAWFLIDKDRNVVEGLELIEKALELSPDEYYMLDTKGWGFYKQGKYQEALGFLQKCDSLKPVYDHDLFLHLEAAKKAVAGLK